MIDWVRKFLYRIFCVVALLVSVYLVLDFLASGTFDYRVFVMFLLMVAVVAWGFWDWWKNYALMRQKEQELRLYQMYMQPLEELVKEIRAKQHEFDNHLNAILNMHLTVDNYQELVERQSAYIAGAAREDESRKYLPLLRISDKVLAGFLYSKIVRAPAHVQTDVEVQSLTLLSGAPEHVLIEIVGTLVDNAYEACAEEESRVEMLLDAQEDRVLFAIRNPVRQVSLEEVGRFFEKGYSTKSRDGSRGLGLYNARWLAERYGGAITVRTEQTEGQSYLCFQVVI